LINELEILRIYLFFKLNNDWFLLNNKQLSDITWVVEWTISNQYREKISDYWKDKQEWWKKYQGIYERWYSNPDSIWKKVNMDEKYANNEYITILSNSCKLMKNKIISIVKWVNPKNTIKKITKFLSQEVRDQVEEVAVDMANGMILIAMILFRNA